MRLPVVGYRCFSRILRALGWREKRRKGSHVILERNGSIVVVPDYREYSRGFLLKLMAQAGITQEEFLSLYEELC